MLLTILLCAIVILSAIFSNRFLNALGIPALLFFMCLGMIFGSDGILKIDFEDFTITKELCSIALGFIIFYGGFCTKWKTAKPVIIRATVLSTLGVLLTALGVCVFLHFFLHLNFLESFLIGATISSTDAASVFSLLRGKNLNLKNNTAPLLEIESGSNDPMSYILVILAITLLQGQSAEFVFILFLKQIIFGILIGILIAKSAILIFQKTKLVTQGYDTLFIIALVLSAYGISELCNGNPFLAVYFLGIICGNSNIPNKITMLNFFDGITKLAQIGIFFILGLLAFPREIPNILETGIYIFLFLTFIARPLVIFLLLAPFKVSFSQTILISWAGLRGVASIVFAIIAINSGITLHYDLFHLVFLISILSVALQGTFLPLISKKTNMLDEFSDIRKTFNDYQEECAIKLLKIKIPSGHDWINKEIKDISFPQSALALVITRNEEKIIPKGSTTLKENDEITISLPTTYEDDGIELKELVLSNEHDWCNKEIKDLHLKNNEIIVLIKREREHILPKGNTTLLEGDVIVLYN